MDAMKTESFGKCVFSMLNVERDLKKVVAAEWPYMRNGLSAGNLLVILSYVNLIDFKKILRDKMDIPDSKFMFVKDAHNSGSVPVPNGISVVLVHCDRNTFPTIASAANWLMDFSQKRAQAKLLFLAHDDLSFADSYSPEESTILMKILKFPFICAPKLNLNNFVFLRKCPRLMFIARKVFRGILSFYTFESNEYTVYDMDSVGNTRFDPSLKIFYLLEFLYRMNKMGDKRLPFIRHYVDGDETTSISRNVSDFPGRRIFSESLRKTVESEQKHLFTDEKMVIPDENDPKVIIDYCTRISNEVERSSKPPENV